MRRALILALLALACGPKRPSAPTDKLARLPREGRAAIYESENEVIMAKSKRDTAARAVGDAERDVEALGASWERARARLRKSGQGARVGPARKVMEAHRRYLKARVDVFRAVRTAAEVEIETAQANLERTRYGELVRYGMASNEGMKPLDERKGQAEDRARQATKREVDQRTRAQKAFAAWKLAEEEFSRATGDYDTGIWID